MVRIVFMVSLSLLGGPALAAPKDDWLARAKSGDHIAQYNLCKSYLYGENGLPKSGRKAYKWCVASAEAGISHAQTLLAEMYRFGTYVKRDDAVAEKYYLLAANQGHIHAQYMLGRMAILREPPDPDMACKWLLQSADQGYDKAKELLDLLEREWKQGKPPETEAYCDAVRKEHPH
jgi:uncharacterized protein